MNKIQTLIFVAVMAVAFTLSGCGNKKNPSGSQSGTSANDIKKEAAHTMETATAYTQQQKEEYQKQLEDKLNAFNQKLEAMKSKAESMKADAKTQYEEEIAALQEKEKEAADKFKELKNESGDAWSKMKTKMDKIVDDLQTDFNQKGS